MMQVKGDNGIEFALADEVATAMIMAGILEPAIDEIPEAIEDPEPEPAKSKK